MCMYLAISRFNYSWIVNWSIDSENEYLNKKVLLRERKRHTTRRVASARYAGWVWWDGVPPTIQTWDGVPPHHPDLGWGTPNHPDLGWGTPPPSRPGMGYPQPSRPGFEYPPPTIQTWDGVPPPPMVKRQTFPSINITFLRTTYAGGNYPWMINSTTQIKDLNRKNTIEWLTNTSEISDRIWKSLGSFSVGYKTVGYDYLNATLPLQINRRHFLCSVRWTCPASLWCSRIKDR